MVVKAIKLGTIKNPFSWSKSKKRVKQAPEGQSTAEREKKQLKARKPRRSEGVQGVGDNRLTTDGRQQERKKPARLKSRSTRNPEKGK